MGGPRRAMSSAMGRAPRTLGQADEGGHQRSSEPSEAASSGLAINYAIELAGIVARRQLASEEAEEATLALSELDSAAMSARYSAAESEVDRCARDSAASSEAAALHGRGIARG